MDNNAYEDRYAYERKMRKKRQRETLLRKKKLQLLCLLIITIIMCIIIRCSEQPSAPLTPAAPVESSDNSNVADVPNTNEEPLFADLPNVLKDDWNLVLINEDNLLTSEPDFEHRYLDNDMQVDARIYDELVQMLEDGTQTGLSFIVCSAYRTISYQEGLFNAQVAKLESEGLSPEDAYATAKTSVALPGASEHHLGLAVDIISDTYRELDEHQATTPQYQWLQANCHKYGFIVRYPQGRTDITGFIYEPWHFRYVGVEAATFIAKHNLSLEEFLALL